MQGNVADVHSNTVLAWAVKLHNDLAVNIPIELHLGRPKLSGWDYSCSRDDLVCSKGRR